MREIGLYKNPYLDRIFKHVIQQDETQRPSSSDRDILNYNTRTLLRYRDVYLRNMLSLQQVVAPLGRVDSVIYPAGAGDISPAEIIFNPKVVIIIDRSAFNPLSIPDIRSICRQAQKLLCLQSMWGYVPGSGYYPSIPAFEYTLANLFLIGVDPHTISIRPMSERLFLIRFNLLGETKNAFYFQEEIRSDNAIKIAKTIMGLYQAASITSYGMLSKGDMKGTTKILLPFLDPLMVLADHLEGPDKQPIDKFLIGYKKHCFTGSLESDFGYAWKKYGPFLFVRN